MKLPELKRGDEVTWQDTSHVLINASSLKKSDLFKIMQISNGEFSGEPVSGIIHYKDVGGAGRGFHIYERPSKIFIYKKDQKSFKPFTGTLVFGSEIIKVVRKSQVIFERDLP